MGKWVLMMFVLLAPPAFGSAYRWVDESGQVHYSDRPVPGAEEISLVASPVPQQPATASTATPPAPTPSSTLAAPYQTLAITGPTEQSTLWNIEGVLDVSVALTPRLRPGDRVAVNLDGGLVDLRPTGLSFQVPDVFRGVHTLEAVVLDPRGQVMIRSEPVNFVVQQTSIVNPQRARPRG